MTEEEMTQPTYIFEKQAHTNQWTESLPETQTQKAFSEAGSCSLLWDEIRSN